MFGKMCMSHVYDSRHQYTSKSFYIINHSSNRCSTDIHAMIGTFSSDKTKSLTLTFRFMIRDYNFNCGFNR